MLDPLLRLGLQLIEPLGLLWLGLIFLTLLLRRRRQTVPYLVCALLTLLVTIIGSTDLSSWLLLRLERPWAGIKLIELPACDAVVVLGGGAEPSRNDVDGIRITKAGDRILTGMELMRWGLAPAMVIGGGSARVDDAEKIESDLIRTRIGDWKPPLTWAIVSLGAAADTHDEAQRLVPLAKDRGWKKILLVTSASHMRRAVSVYRAAGFDVVPAPCNFIVTGNASPPSFRIGIPSWYGFERFSIWLHEIAGWESYRRKGWLDEK
jgi:uncharacterized SAM-binding protein YcdF (DUF218 family)